MIKGTYYHLQLPPIQNSFEGLTSARSPVRGWRYRDAKATGVFSGETEGQMDGWTDTHKHMYPKAESKRSHHKFPNKSHEHCDRGLNNVLGKHKRGSDQVHLQKIRKPSERMECLLVTSGRQKAGWSWRCSLADTSHACPASTQHHHWQRKKEGQRVPQTKKVHSPFSTLHLEPNLPHASQATVRAHNSEGARTEHGKTAGSGP